ncbi:glycosyltransferase family 2 protein [Gordonia sp. zg691]|uniref:glycosyltransferase n=1 Tax=Gordonia jinghuaiqii TaxID=2758710 RepID=UPI0016624106|nr:glycosyltransferase family 2 protein [Gordonia jinghuaiqii]MBD0860963.1 glycosyltransferase family 2 protein [Gordonia jinghuaiqii]
MSTLSVVVPAYNEEATIGACLDRLVNQTRPIDEIIVVDNASDDGTAAIVAQYAASHPEIRLVTESRPGIYWARRAGFDAATGTVLARTDADTLVSAGWAEAIVEHFDGPRGDEYACLTGPILFWGGPAYDRLKRMSLRGELAENGGEFPSMSGQNTALRADAWAVVRDRLLDRVDIWEDMDLSMTLVELGYRVWFTPGMLVDTSARQLRFSPLANRHYMLGGIRTAHARGDRKVIAKMYVELPFRLVLWTFLWVMFGGWDDDAKSWSVRTLFTRKKRSRALITDQRTSGADGVGDTA